MHDKNITRNPRCLSAEREYPRVPDLYLLRKAVFLFFSFHGYRHRQRGVQSAKYFTLDPAG